MSINVNQSQFDYVNDDNEFIIKPGHLWEYENDSRDTVSMVMTADGKPAMVTDESLPTISIDRPFMFTNPFLIKIHRDPTTSMNYNYLIDHTSWP